MANAAVAGQPARKPGIRWLPIAMLLVLGALWGGNPTFSKALAQEGVSPFGVVFWQTGIAGLILLIVCGVKRARIPFDRKSLAYYVFIGSIGTALSYATIVFVIGHVSAGYVSVLIVLSPLLTYLFAIVVRLETLSLLRAIGILLGLAGAAILVVPQGSLPSPEALPYALIALAIPAGYAAANVYAEWGRPAGVENVALATGTMFAAAVAMALLGLADGSFHAAWNAQIDSQLLLLAYGASTAAAFMLFYVIVSRDGAVYLGQVGYLVTIAGIAWGMLFFGETHSDWLWLAVVVVFAGVALVNFGKRRPAG